MKKTIVYLHGYGSSGLTGTADYLRRKLLEYDVLTPDIPVDPQEALPFLKQYCKDYHADQAWVVCMPCNCRIISVFVLILHYVCQS